MVSQNDDAHWDVFVCYAAEDRAEVAEPLALTLQGLGVRTWYDETELRVGDSLRQKIDEGLAKCRFGVVIVSPKFFAKHWPQRELDALATRGSPSEGSIILPVWYQVGQAEVVTKSPLLASIKALIWSDGPMTVIFQLMRRVRPDLLREILEKPKLVYSKISTARQLTTLVMGAMALHPYQEDATSVSEARLIAAFIDEVKDLAEFGRHNMSETARVSREVHLDACLGELAAEQWEVWGTRGNWGLYPPSQPGQDSLQLPTAFVAVVEKNATAVWYIDDRPVVFRPDEDVSK